MSETPILGLEPGTLVRFTQDVHDVSSGRTIREGWIAEVEDFVSAEESDWDGKPFYWGVRGDGVSSVCFPADCFEVTMTAAEASAREVPSLQDIRRLIAHALCGSEGHGVKMIDEAETYGSGPEVTLYGEADNGLRFAFSVTVEAPWRVEL